MATTGRLRRVLLVGWAVVCFSAWPAVANEPDSQPSRQLVATEGKGYLELVDGYRVLHLAGSPAQMGRQHGILLREAVRANCEFLLADEGKEPVKLGPVAMPRKTLIALLISRLTPRIPQPYMVEMKALAQAAGLDEQVVLGCNLIPEMFHCSGFALLSDATADKTLLHGRVLDYAVNLRLQECAVLIIQEPDGGIPFVNVSYAGFIGSVTGMNLQQVSIGEMGGGGQGQWDGVPMSFLVRRVLQEARTLEEALAIFRQGPRTCEYYYVIADAKGDSAVGIRATPSELEIILPGQAHPELPMPQPATVIMSAGKRYPALAGLIQQGWGRFTQESAIRLMDAPVAMKHNLHDALMVPGHGVVYVANAAPDGSPAWEQKYHRFDIRELMGIRPENLAAAADAAASR